MPQPATVEKPAAADKPAARVIELKSGVLPPRQRENIYDRMIGKTFDDRYLIEARLGEGGMGVVFRARHVVIEKAVAIKVLKREVARDQSVVRRFVQEARAASRIGHPNIVDVTDFGVTPDGMTYQVMEYIEGETLSAAMKAERPMPAARALPIVAQLCRALGAAHDKGIVHRDLKPENVFLISTGGRRDFVKVVDFGIAKVQPAPGTEGSPRLTRAGTVFGTPEYMAPEQAQGKGDTDQRVDVYALGTILYEMLTGTVPHRGESAMRTLAMQLLDPIVPPRQLRPGLAISDGLEAVVMRALAKNRDQRYPSMPAMLADLTRVAGDVTIDQPLSPSAEPLDDSPDTVPEGALVMSDAALTLSMGAPEPAPVESLGPVKRRLRRWSSRPAPLPVPGEDSGPGFAAPGGDAGPAAARAGPAGRAAGAGAAAAGSTMTAGGRAVRPRPMTLDSSGGAGAAAPRRRGWAVALVVIALLAAGAAGVILIHRSMARTGGSGGPLAVAGPVGDGGPAAKPRQPLGSGGETAGAPAPTDSATADPATGRDAGGALDQVAARQHRDGRSHDSDHHTAEPHAHATETGAAEPHAHATETGAAEPHAHAHATETGAAEPHAHAHPPRPGRPSLTRTPPRPTPPAPTATRRWSCPGAPTPAPPSTPDPRIWARRSRSRSSPSPAEASSSPTAPTAARTALTSADPRAPSSASAASNRRGPARCWPRGGSRCTSTAPPTLRSAACARKANASRG